ncbi:MAG: M23 family metallopeptidase [Beijerinckiaceae bacterium]
MSTVRGGVTLTGFRRSKGAIADPAGTMRVRRATFVTLGLMTGLTTIWAAGATTFIVMRDDLAARLISRQVENQYAYEERITALRTHVDRLASRQVIDQDTVENRVADLMSRQSQLETRSAMVAMLAQNAGMATGQTAQANPANADAVVTGSITAIRKTSAATIAPQAPVAAGVMSFAPVSKPTPIVDTLPLRGLQPRASDTTDRGEIRERISTIGKALDSIETAQAATIRGIEVKSRQQVARLRSLLSDVGVNADKIAATADPATAKTSAVGGPLVPLNDPNALQFETSLKRVQTLLGAASKLKKTVRTLPVRQPIANSLADMTSNYGPRSDPFTRGYAMHTGIDFRAETGTPVRATAAGKVVTSDYTGGYGNMVEIDHGNGLTTRYAHLSELLVEEGDMIEAGKIVGKVGSTGRSTGPHLHYETRVSGDPADPSRFIRTGAKYKDLL